MSCNGGTKGIALPIRLRGTGLHMTKHEIRRQNLSEHIPSGEEISLKPESKLGIIHVVLNLGGLPLQREILQELRLLCVLL